MTSGPSKTPAVSCRQLTKNYGQGNSEVMALRGVDLDVYPGELTLLVGPSGCGKTTLLSVLAGILNPTAGDMIVLGTRPAQLPDHRKVQFRRQNIGFVFQQFNLLPSLSAAENVCVPLLLAGWSRRKAMRVAIPLLERMEMGGRLLTALPATLSGGQQQRVAIARCFPITPGCWSAMSQPPRSMAKQATPSWNCSGPKPWRAIGP